MQIDIIGQGNVGHHLHYSLNKANIKLINSRTFEGLREDSDLYLICVSDDGIGDVASQLNPLIPQNATVAHTSGSTAMSILSAYFKNFGVFYPLQTFSKQSRPDYNSIPLFLESNNESSRKIIQDAADLFNNKSRWIDSDTRKKLHISSVLACNFTNHLWSLVDEYMKRFNLEFDDIRPLIFETVRKLEDLSPFEAQTGPAVRGDKKIIETHLRELQDFPDLLRIYREITNSIMHLHLNESL